jgi:hypothetical protein
MSESLKSSRSVLERLLKSRTDAAPPGPAQSSAGDDPPAPRTVRERVAGTKKPGRPAVPEEKKAKNFTLCLAPRYLEFLDRMVVRDPKVRGRGRKIRFIIERFIEHERRSVAQLRVLREGLVTVQQTLGGFGARVRKGEKLNLSPRESEAIGKAVDQVHLLLRILNYSPKTLHKLLPREEWAVLSFCLDWKANRAVVF